MSIRWTPKQCKDATEELKKEIFTFLPSLKGKRVLDVGCGVGRITNEFLNNSSEVYAIDISPSMLIKARRKLKSKGVKIFRESAHNLRFDDDFFDLTFEVTVLQHIPNKNLFKQTLKEIKRVTNKEGLIFLCGEMSKKDKRISPHTTLRSVKTYAKEMKPWKLVKTKNHKCITDNYKLMLWSL